MPSRTLGPLELMEVSRNGWRDAYRELLQDVLEDRDRLARLEAAARAYLKARGRGDALEALEELERIREVLGDD